MSRKILCVGFQLATDINSEVLSARTSLLDWDIVLFKPVISEFLKYQSDGYLGKVCLDDTASFSLKESCEHWRREIKEAFENGKTIIVFLPELEEVYVATGGKQFSGTGRNQRTTRLVDTFSNYRCLPLNLKPVNSIGTSIKLTPKRGQILASLWNEFQDSFQYKVILEDATEHATLVTKTGEKTVGAIFRSQGSLGTIVVVPDIDFAPSKFFRVRDGNRYWSSDAKEFASRLVTSVTSLDKTLRNSAEITPEPSWALESKYLLKKESALKARLLEAEKEVEKAQRHKEQMLESLQSAGRLRALLFEKGKPLEHAIIESLKMMGFKASSYRDEDSEFDVVFESTEGRLIGEAEGKDNKAINIEKLRQLAMNINEDLQREEVAAPAKAVLFGNGYRLTSPPERDIQFTEKCITAATASNTALLPTSELFSVAQYLSDHADDAFAQSCRRALVDGVGLIQLPQAPNEGENIIETVEEK